MSAHRKRTRDGYVLASELIVKLDLRIGDVVESAEWCAPRRVTGVGMGAVRLAYGKRCMVECDRLPDDLRVTRARVEARG